MNNDIFISTNHLPNEIENIIFEYLKQMNSVIKYKKVIKQINKINYTIDNNNQSGKTSCLMLIEKPNDFIFKQYYCMLNILFIENTIEGVKTVMEYNNRQKKYMYYKVKMLKTQINHNRY